MRMAEHMAPEVIAEKRKIYKGVNANVDFYSGLVYSMLDLLPPGTRRYSRRRVL